MNVLIFGGSGFLGSEINNLLNKNQFNCHTASFNNPKSDYKIDISNIDSFKHIPYDYFNIIINCATRLIKGANTLSVTLFTSDKIFFPKSALCLFKNQL